MMIRPLAAFAFTLGTVAAQIPFHQDKVPNEPYDPKTALTKMTVPDGFSVELVASEPDIVNPIGMAFDEKGRIWITESLEYPRKSPGKGRDRVKVLEDTDHDGSIDKVTVFATGLNIPSGIAVGHGGVWVVNSPDLLLMQDTDGDLKADKIEVIATGFGRDDTHELPNSLTWGPDGHLYGLNGVFNHSRVTQDLDGDGAPDDGKTWRFTCAMFRINPLTKKFSIFCEGTSNPWGIAFDENGSAFISACVIDHLWHLVETGYYHRQGGRYPEHVWKLRSIVKHKHQKAAYCGITWFDSAAYPKEYRGVLYMGNIHGNCLNADVVEQRGSSYFGKPREDFLSVDDAWFMPVVQKTGPDGCLYVLDWYDRYHCYQDARRDAKGIDRLKGRLYRIRYDGTPRAPAFDLAKETDAALMKRLASPNVFFRRTAQRLLTERDDAETRSALEKMALDSAVGRKARLHALWAMVSTGRLTPEFHLRVMQQKDPTFRAWGVRAAGNFGSVSSEIRKRIVELASDKSPEVRLQVAIAARKIVDLDPLEILVRVLSNSDDDEVIPPIVWQNLHPLLSKQGAGFLKQLRGIKLAEHAALSALMPRVVERILWDGPKADFETLLALFEAIIDAAPKSARRCLASLAEILRMGQLPKARSRELRARLGLVLGDILDGSTKGPLFTDAALLATMWGEERGHEAARRILADRAQTDDVRLRTIDALIAGKDRSILPLAKEILEDSRASSTLQIAIIGSLGRVKYTAIAGMALDAYPKLRPEVRPAAIDLLTQRASWSRSLLAAVETTSMPFTALNGHQIRNLRNQFGEADAAVVKRIEAIWGAVRTTRNANREKVIADIRSLLLVRRGDPHRGREVFAATCGQCHKIFGKGADIGPDLTGSGRGSFAQLLSNVLDPNLVVSEAYQLRTVITHNDRIVAGMLAEKSDKRVIIRTIGGKAETFARKDVKEILESPLSFMPEALESTITRDQLIDLFALLLREHPPEVDNPATIPGYSFFSPRQTQKPKEFNAILSAVAPGFTVKASGDDGVALIREHLGRSCVVRTHPLARNRACILSGYVTPPLGRKTTLELSVSHHEARGRARNWRLLVKVDGKTIHEQMVGPKTASKGWVDLSIDLSAYAGKRIKLELHNHASGWSYEFAYWGRVALVVGD